MKAWTKVCFFLSFLKLSQGGNRAKPIKSDFREQHIMDEKCQIMPWLQTFVEGLHFYKLKILQYFLTATLEVRSNYQTCVNSFKQVFVSFEFTAYVFANPHKQSDEVTVLYLSH